MLLSLSFFFIVQTNQWSLTYLFFWLLLVFNNMEFRWKGSREMISFSVSGMDPVWTRQQYHRAARGVTVFRVSLSFGYPWVLGIPVPKTLVFSGDTQNAKSELNKRLGQVTWHQYLICRGPKIIARRRHKTIIRS